MFDKRSTYKIVSDEQLKHASRRRQPKNSSKLRVCQICGDRARIINYGALSCQPCKTFFRRNGCHPERLPSCIHNDNCDINKESRRSCSSCRLAKCISKGMTPDLIRKEEQKSSKNSSTSRYTKNIHTMRMSTKTLVPSHPKRYLFFDYEQGIVSNVIHALKVYSAIPKVREIIEDELALIFDLPFNVSSATECVHHIFTSVRCFINSIPDFRIMAVSEQSSLFQRNFHGLVSLYSAFVFRQTGIMHRPDLIASFTSVYGLQMATDLVKTSKQLTIDSTTIKLLLLILTFSSNCSMVDYPAENDDDDLLTGTFRLLGSQDAYVTILWKHMIYQYGYYKAACHLSKLIGFSVNLTKALANTCTNNELYHRLVDEFDQNSKQWLVANQNEHIRLWGASQLSE